MQGTANPAHFTLDAGLAQVVQLQIDTPTTDKLIAKVYRPGTQDAGLPPRKTLTLYQGTNRYPLTVDWPGRWTIEVSGAVDAAVYKFQRADADPRFNGDNLLISVKTTADGKRSESCTPVYPPSGTRFECNVTFSGSDKGHLTANVRVHLP